MPDVSVWSQLRPDRCSKGAAREPRFVGNSPVSWASPAAKRPSPEGSSRDLALPALATSSTIGPEASYRHPIYTLMPASTAGPGKIGCWQYRYLRLTTPNHAGQRPRADARERTSSRIAPTATAATCIAALSGRRPAACGGDIISGSGNRSPSRPSASGRRLFPRRAAWSSRWPPAEPRRGEAAVSLSTSPGPAVPVAPT